MYKGKLILAIIPARKGSKRIPRKNVRKLNGVPLVTYTINSAKKSKYIDRIVVSTDDIRVAKIAKKHKIEVLKRSKKLSEDHILPIQVYENVANELKKKEHYLPDIIVALQPTSPLREGKDIDLAITTLVDKNADSLDSFSRAKEHPSYAFKIDDNMNAIPIDKKNVAKMSQYLPKRYTENGLVFAFKTETITKHKTQYGKIHKAIITDYEKSIDIDEEIDWKLAELILKKRKKNRLRNLFKKIRG